MFALRVFLEPNTPTMVSIFVLQIVRHRHPGIVATSCRPTVLGTVGGKCRNLDASPWHITARVTPVSIGGGNRLVHRLATSTGDTACIQRAVDMRAIQASASM